MAAKNLVPQILEAYKAARPALSAQDMEPVEAFCRFATSWLGQVGFIGMSHSPNGLALRTKTGDELLVAPDAAVPVAFSRPVAVTGNENKLMVNTPPRPDDIAVTGGS
jgi:hypothetical protein